MAYSVGREELPALHDEWARLVEQQPEPIPFVHPAWHRVWLDEFLDGRELLLLAVRENSELAGVGSFVRHDGRLSFAGHHSICDYMDVVLAPGRERNALVALLDSLASESWT
jgi:hypothetical protein